MPMLDKEKLKKQITQLQNYYNLSQGDYEAWNDPISEVLEIIDDMPKTNIDLLLAFKDKVKAWWNEVYPEEIFPVENKDIPEEDRDEGAKRVAEIRELIKKIESEDRNE